MSDDTHSGMNPALKIILGVALGLLLLFCLGGAVVFYVLRGGIDAYSENVSLMQTEAQMEELRNALTAHRLESGELPESLDELVGPTGTLQGDAVPQDGWGNEFIYVLSEDGESYELISLGSDGLEGGEEHAADLRVTNAPR